MSLWQKVDNSCLKLNKARKAHSVCTCTCVLIIKPKVALISQLYFWNRALDVSYSFSVHHQESSTVHSNGIRRTAYAFCLLAGSGCSILIPLASSQHNLYDIYLLLCVQCQTPDGGQRNCKKLLEFYSKNKFEKLVNLLGFIIRIYHDARSSECQMSVCVQTLRQTVK